MLVELFPHPECPQCAADQRALRAAALEVDPTLVWAEVDPWEEPDYAIDLGVIRIPAIAIDGRLAFSGLPTPEQLRLALQRRLAHAATDAACQIRISHTTSGADRLS